MNNERIERIVPRAGLKIRDQKGQVLKPEGEARVVDVFWLRSQAAGDVTFLPVEKENQENLKVKDKNLRGEK